jgi:GWxTD domain-containing protein
MCKSSIHKYLYLITVIISLAIFLVMGNGLSFAKSKKPQLAKKYRDWQDSVQYIITGEELGTFKRLTNHRDRDVFINLFWNLRDPLIGTQINEYKVEHERRFAYAQRYFKFGSPRAGWKTDMGRMYIILGEPNSKNRFEMDNVIYPAQIWNYYGKNRPGLPASFRVVFFKDHGMGEFKIYDPSVNMPSQLIKRSKATHDISFTDTEGNYQALLQEHPELARASLSLIPNDTPANYTPSLRSTQLLTTIIRSPQKRINDSYATNFLKYKGKVDVDYSINYVESLHRVEIINDPETGLNFVHFAIKPRNLSAQSTGDSNTYFFNFMLNVSLYKGDRSVFEYRKNFPYTGDKDNVLQTFFNSMIISDFFPAEVGEYRLSVLLQNVVNKEFTFFDTNISIPQASPAKPEISSLMLAREVKQVPRQVYLPFKFRDYEVTPDPGKEFGTQEKVTALFSLNRGKYKRAIEGLVQIKAIADNSTFKKAYPFDVSADPNLNVKIHTLTQELEPLSAGYYELSLIIKDEKGQLLDQKSENFTVSFLKQVPQTTHIFKTIPSVNRFVYFHITGLQNMRMNRFAQADGYFAKALKLRPKFGRLINDYCRLSIKMKKFDRVLQLAQRLKTGQKDLFDYHSFTGKALFFKGQYPEALKHLSEANRIYDSDITVLNYLGFAYLKSGNKAEAKKVFEASIRLNENQKNISDMLKELTDK